MAGSPPGDEQHRNTTQTVVITGQRLRGSVRGDVEPDAQLDEAQVRSFGATTVGELVNALAPQTRRGGGAGGGSGNPIVLLNGRRIGSFGEIASLPPEAIERVDILPPEVALSYGYRPDQGVLNIVLKENFRTITASGAHSFPTRGGQSSYEAGSSIVRIGTALRWNLDASYQRTSALLESARNLVQTDTGLPFDLLGNIGPSPYRTDAEIDSVLTAAAGFPVEIARVPEGAASGPPTLADFLSGANNPRITETGRFRSLLPASDSLTLNGTVSATLFGFVGATLNASLVETSSESMLGLRSFVLTVPDDSPFSPFSRDVTLFRYADATHPLLRRTRGRTAHGGLTLAGELSDWHWTLIANYDRARTLTRTDSDPDPAPLQARLDAGDPDANPFAPIASGWLAGGQPDRAESVVESGEARMLVGGSPLRLPGGAVRVSLGLAFDTRSLRSSTIREETIRAESLARDRAVFQGNIDLPLIGQRGAGIARVGALSLNLNWTLENISEFGALWTLGYGIRWQPDARLEFAINVIDRDGAPSIQQLNDPILVTPNARLFDFVRGETIDVARIEGGNPALVGEHRRLVSVGATYRPLGRAGPGRPVVLVAANFTRNRLENAISAFPIPTAEFEAAFPERFVRGPDGRLLRLDARPVNFERSDSEQLRWGITFIKSFAPPAAQTNGLGAAGTGGINFSLFHTWHLVEKTLIRPGVPALDYLSGSALGLSGGRPRHEIEMQAGYSHNGLSGFLRANWRSGTVTRSGRDQRESSSELRFSPFSTVSLILNADLGQQLGTSRGIDFLRGMQVQFGVTNLFDSRPHVYDRSGDTPQIYRPAYIDPIGRSVKFGIRRLFP